MKRGLLVLSLAVLFGGSVYLMDGNVVQASPVVSQYGNVGYSHYYDDDRWDHDDDHWDDDRWDDDDDDRWDHDDDDDDDWDD